MAGSCRRASGWTSGLLQTSILQVQRGGDLRVQLLQRPGIVDHDVGEPQGLRELLGSGIGRVLEALLARELLERRAVADAGAPARAFEADRDRRVDAEEDEPGDAPEDGDLGGAANGIDDGAVFSAPRDAGRLKACDDPPGQPPGAEPCAQLVPRADEVLARMIEASRARLPPHDVGEKMVVDPEPLEVVSRLS